jgi:hypothetical protein
MTLDQATSTMTPSELNFEVQRGGRFIIFQYVFSVLVMTFKRNAPIQFVKAGENPALAGLPWTLLSLVAGWWGFPWGLIYTPQVVIKNCGGGTDVTQAVLTRIQSTAAPPPRR